MKKSLRIFLTTAFLLLLIIQISPQVKAECDPGDSPCILAEQFGLNQSQIPDNPEDLKQRYLQAQWEDVIAKNNVLGPIHQFFRKINWLFIILFAHPYEISLQLLVIIILWFVLGSEAGKIIEGLGFAKSWAAFSIGMLFAVILAQIRFIKLISGTFLDLLFKQEHWITRLVIFLIFLVIIVVSYRASKALAKKLKEQKREKLMQKQEEQVNRVGKFQKGASLD